MKIRRPKAETRKKSKFRRPKDLGWGDRYEIVEPGSQKDRSSGERRALFGEARVRFAKPEVEY
jgi:hypothetical protein